MPRPFPPGCRAAGSKSFPTACSSISAAASRTSRRRRARSSPRTRCAGSTGCSTSGLRASRRQCRRQNCTFMPERGSTARPERRGWTRFWRGPKASPLTGYAGSRRSAAQSWRPRCPAPESCFTAVIPGRHSVSRSPRRRQWACRRSRSPWVLRRNVSSTASRVV